MKRHKKLTVALIVLFSIMGISREFTVQADEISGNSLAEVIAETEEDDTAIPVETEEVTENAGEPDSGAQMPAVVSEAPTEPPAFQAKVEWSNQGWIVKGCFQDMTSDTILVQPMCSTDGEIYFDCGQEWRLDWLSSEDEGAQKKVRNQRCLYASEEPFKSYLAKDLDHFFIKLRIVREGGIAFETQASVIERKEQQPEPEEVELIAKFAPCMLVREGRPPTMRYYGRYQITVREDATVKEIEASLPDTLPVEVGVYRDADIVGSDIVDCPVRWKSLEPAQLAAGEGVTLSDAAEEILVPAGTVLHTQTGIYRVEEPLPLYQYGSMTDEVSLILNVVAKDGQPEGVLAEENHGLEIAFSLKPTGARAIHAFFFREGDEAWTEIEELSLSDLVNDQHSTASSGYALVLGKDQEPLMSYRKAREAGKEPTPFCVGLKIEGGVYDDRQLVLAWPATYELPPQLPKVGGSGGNEGNAGSDDRDDGTEEGQRPGLPKEPSESTEEPTEPQNQQPSRPSREKPSAPSEKEPIEPSKEGMSGPPKEETSEPLKEPLSVLPREEPPEQPKEQASELPEKQPSEAPKKQPEIFSEERENQILAAEDPEPTAQTGRETKGLSWEGYGKVSETELSALAEQRTDQGVFAVLPAAAMAILLVGGAAVWRAVGKKRMGRR